MPTPARGSAAAPHPAAGPAPGAPTTGSPGWRRRSPLNHVKDGFEPEAVERPGSSSNRYFFFQTHAASPVAGAGEV